MFSDLECDFVNPIDLCAKLNPVSECGSFLKQCHFHDFVLLCFCAFTHLHIYTFTLLYATPVVCLA